MNLIIIIIKKHNKNQENKWPIFIVSTHRAGSTLLSRLLNAHANLACPPESKFIAALQALFDYPQSYAGLRGLGLSRDDIYEKIKDFINSIMADYARHSGKARWVDKTPNYCRLLPFIDAVFHSEVIYIVLVRHPLDQLLRRGAVFLSVLNTSVTKQTGDMVYSEARRRRLLSIGQRTTMLYALERESDLGSTFAVSVELSEGRAVGSGPVSLIWDIASNRLLLDQSLQRDGAGGTRRSQPPPTQLFACDARADREHDPRASGQASVLGRAQAEGQAGDATGRRGLACS